MKMKRGRWVAIVVCLAMALAAGCAAADEDTRLRVEVGGSQGNGLIPAGIVTQLKVRQPLVSLVVDEIVVDSRRTNIEEWEVQRLFELIADAEVSPTQLEKGRYEFDVDGSGISGDLTPFVGNSFYFSLRGMRGKPETLLNMSYGDALADDHMEDHFYLLRSEELKAHVLEMCQWETYALDELVDARAIVVSELAFDEAKNQLVLDEEGNRTFNPVAKIEDAERIKTVTDGMRTAKILERGSNFLPGIRLEFEFEDGSVKYAYMAAWDASVDPRVEAGGNFIRIVNRRMWKIIGDLFN